MYNEKTTAYGDNVYGAPVGMVKEIDSREIEREMDKMYVALEELHFSIKEMEPAFSSILRSEPEGKLSMGVPVEGADTQLGRKIADMRVRVHSMATEVRGILNRREI